MDIVIEPTGDARAVYGEELDLGILGDVNIERASHVEPIEHGVLAFCHVPGLDAGYLQGGYDVLDLLLRVVG